MPTADRRPVTEQGEMAGSVAAVVHNDPETRIARGEQAREAAPLESHALWKPAKDRLDPVDLLASQEEGRVRDLIPVRHDRMMASPFAFYRGAAIIQAADLGANSSTDLLVQGCGDAHLANFGGYRAPDRSLVFDINDFDETNPAPFEWDVKRLAASFELAGRESGIKGHLRRAVVHHVVRTYRETMARFAEMRNIEVWYARLDVEGILQRWGSELGSKAIESFRKNVSKAAEKDSMRAFAKLTEHVGDEYRIASHPPLLVPLRELEHAYDPDAAREWLHQHFRLYRRTLQADRRHLLESYAIIDAARKVVGVGSVGTRSWVLFLLGRDQDDPLFLQVKEADASVLEAHTGKSEFANHGQRVVEGQRLLQATSDVMLGWVRSPGLDGSEHDFYVRQLWDGKISPHYETMSHEESKVFGEMCGWALARGHARSGDRIAIAAYLGPTGAFEDAVVDYAAVYADQTVADYETVKASWRATGP